MGNTGNEELPEEKQTGSHVPIMHNVSSEKTGEPGGIRKKFSSIGRNTGKNPNGKQHNLASNKKKYGYQQLPRNNSRDHNPKNQNNSMTNERRTSLFRNRLNRFPGIPKPPFGKGLNHNPEQGESRLEKITNKILKTIGKKITNKVALSTLAGIFIVVVLFIIAIVVVIGSSIGDDDEDTTEDNTYTVTVNNTRMWWPIGSSDTKTVNGKTFATGTPSCTRYTEDYSPVVALDMACGTTNIIAVMDGTVESAVTNCKPWNMVGGESKGAQAKCGGTYGNNVVINHGNGIKTRYAHLSSVKVNVGDKVNQGQVIGIEGNTGHVKGTTGIHLHFEVIVNGTRVIPSRGYVSSADTRPMSENATYGNSTSKTKVKGNSLQQTVCLYFKKKGLSDEAIAGIMGNMQRESNFQPAVVNYIGCVGLFQWCYGRKNAIKNTFGSSWTDANNQLDYMWYEITETSENGVLKYLKGSYSASDLAAHFCRVYERPEAGECASGKRQAYANSLYSYVKNGCN